MVSCLSRFLERPDEHNHQWRKVQRSDPSSPIHLVFALKQQRVAELHDVLLEVSRPSAETTSTVKNWLTAQGIALRDIENATPNGDFLRIRTTVGFAEQLLNCDYYDYVHDHYGDDHFVSRVDFEM